MDSDFEVWSRATRGRPILSWRQLEVIDGLVSVERFEGLSEPASYSRCRFGATRRPSRTDVTSPPTVQRRARGGARSSPTTGGVSRA